jgi:hypothetical protein
MQKTKALKVLGNLDMDFASVLMVGLIVLTFVGVIRRYFLRDPHYLDGRGPECCCFCGWYFWEEVPRFGLGRISP